MRRALIVLAVASALAGTSACTGGDDETPELTKVTFMTSAGTSGRDAYAYVAQERGYFREAGFEVEIVPGAGSQANLNHIAAGQAQITAFDLTALLVATGGPEPVAGLVAVGAVHQRTLAAIISLEGDGLTTPQALEGKKLVDAPGSAVRTLFPTYASRAGIDADKVTWLNGTPDTVVRTLADGQTDGIGQVIVGRPAVESATEGRAAVVLPYSEVLPDLYGDVLITTQAYAEEKPDEVRKLTGALLRGLTDAVADPVAAAEILKKAVPATDSEAAAAELSLMAPYVPADGGRAVGALDQQRVGGAIRLLEDSGQIPVGLTPDRVIDFAVVPS